ncbi:cilia- and flagella-associated protein 298 isoform X1 [Haplochromis burtoni]|uniref:Cilia and flagella associated protein 298 n=2 Tax=Haplochromis burtoni TaxID=8153 RepID=A0A3Q2V6Z4_HAPBU|nr:cilia- and flagella-associated protein 298 isoform X1 [Haplochromis burtoni]
MVTHCCPTEGKWLVVFKFHSGPNFLLFQTYLSGRWGKQVLLSEMVQLHVKRGDESLFLFNTTVDTPLETLIQQITAIYNGRLKVKRLCSEIPELADHGISLPPNMQGLTEEQIEELNLRDEWGENCIPSGGSVFRKDDIGRRNGQAPNDKMKEVLMRTVEAATALISKKQVQANVCVTVEMIKEALDQLRGAVMIVYPMGLPPHDPIRMELEDKEDLSGTQVSLQVIAEDECQLWWAAKEMQRGKKLQDYIGRNEKTKLVVKIQKKGQGAPAREPVITDDQQKQMMMHYYRRQEELKKLEEADDDRYLDSEWSDRQALKRQFQGLTNIKWGPR